MDRGRGRQLRRKDNIGLEDDRSRWYQLRNPAIPGRPADLGSREQFNAAGVVVSAYKYHSLLLLFPVPSPRFPYPPISSILMRVVFIPCTSLTRSIYEFVELLVLVLEPEVRACSVVSSRSSSLFCTMTSVYFCFSLSYVRVLFYSPPRTHSSSFSSFSYLPTSCSPPPFLLPSAPYRPLPHGAASISRQIKPFSSRIHTSRTELTRRSRAFLCYIRAPAYNRLFIFYVNVHCPSRILVPYHAYFFPHPRPAYPLPF